MVDTPSSAAGRDDVILLFDGVCNLCNGTVNFILDRERGEEIRFGSLQSKPGQALLREIGFSLTDLQSLVLIERGRSFTRSTAALRLARYLRFPWRALGVFRLIPPFLRNWAYNLVARNRYRWFGKSEQCRVPTPELRARFLDEPSFEAASQSD